MSSSAKKTMKMPAVEEIKRPGSAMSTNSTGSNSSDMRKLNIKQKITLSVEQQKVLAMVVDGKNMFFTGSAGESDRCRSALLMARNGKVCPPSRNHQGASEEICDIAGCCGSYSVHRYRGLQHRRRHFALFWRSRIGERGARSDDHEIEEEQESRCAVAEDQSAYH